ncbi:MAG: SAM-dependent methyltransferase [Polyangiaceae bacterium]
MDSSSHRSTTAEGTAFCRALGALARDPRLRNPDHLAHHFVTRTGWRLGLLPVLRGLARRGVEERLPGGYLLLQVRTRVFDDLLLTAIRDRTSQLVILGAGGDSRAYRFQQKLGGVTVFEVDHPATSAWKQGCVRRMLGSLPDNVRYVPIDFSCDALGPALENAHFDRSARALFLWEGVTMYLRPDAVDGVLSLVAGAPAGSSIVFDYVYAESIAHPERFEGAVAQAKFTASRGEPFLFGISPEPDRLSAFLAARGLELVRRWDHEHLRALYPGPGFLMPYLGVVHARVPMA